jgi:hypothetical protein
MARSRIAAVVARLFGRGPTRTSPVDSLGVVLNAAAETGAVIVVPGISAWLGCGTHTDPDFTASIGGGFTESLEDFCDRISKAEA